MSDAPPETIPASEHVPAVELSDAQRALRDHILGAFPAAQASGYRGELTLDAPASDLLGLLRFCRDDPEVSCELLSDISAVHWPGGTRVLDEEETTGWPTYVEQRDVGRIDLSYILRSVTRGHVLRVRIAVDDAAPSVDSATSVYSSADFLEREILDLMGVQFAGHPNPKRIMMPDDWDGHPHRKDYPLGGVEVMYKGKTVPPPDERDY